MPGILLQDAWASWNENDDALRIGCIQSIARLLEELCSLDFPAFGSIYFNTSDRPPGAVRIDDTYCIGPHCGRLHSGSSDRSAARLRLLTAPGLQRGPWETLTPYFSDMMTISSSVIAHDMFDPTRQDRHRRLIDDYMNTLETITNTETVQSISHPTLSPPDFHKANILVDPDDTMKITGILNWQSATVDPAFVHTTARPDFARLLDMEGIEKKYDEVPAEVVEMQTAAWRCARTWFACTREMPKIGDAVEIDPSLSGFLAAIPCGHLEDDVSVSYLLARLEEDWQKLKLPGQCSYSLSEDEVTAFGVIADERQDGRQLKWGLAAVLDCETDGWVEASKWEEVLSKY